MKEGSNPCTGCAACAVACPQKCIEMKLDSEGFLAPLVREQSCTECGICEEVCYKYLNTDTIKSRESFIDSRVLAVVNNYFQQIKTVSSAGVATSLALHYQAQGYSVCGCVFDVSSDACFHVVASTEREIDRMKGSKYLQSNTLSAFSELIISEKPAIVFGTPCQIYGIREVIRNRAVENRFILVDLFCRGIPSFHLWTSYKSFIKRKFGLEEPCTVDFRDKSRGWHGYGMRITDSGDGEYVQSLYNDLFFYFYLKSSVISSACYKCKFRNDLSAADIRLGDFWGSKYIDYDEGVSLVALLTKKGEEAFDAISSKLRYEECTLDDIYESQRIGAIPVPKDRMNIISSLANGDSLESVFISHRQNQLADDQT
ncbi:MAG: Coenzyme F420 hydrogenase/dehydrogenase, beta subunit C-terminal domain [Sphaerochaetaceae bacterium]|nr:Coenzyme F420 hydrogenase/dehydrogenase, beta subunit C-terminal domain [Sphaerochaetaceae bacterium]